MSSQAIKWRAPGGKRFSGREYRGSNFRFRAMGGLYRVVVRGSGVYLFAGGRGQVTLRGSAISPHKDGTYSLNDGNFRSLPKRPITRKIGRG